MAKRRTIKIPAPMNDLATMPPEMAAEFVRTLASDMAALQRTDWNGVNLTRGEAGRILVRLRLAFPDVAATGE